MLKDFLLSTWIHLVKNKIHSLIGILSLTVGLTVFALLFLYVKHGLSYDRSWPGADNIYRLVLDENNPSTGVFSSSTTTNHFVLSSLRSSFVGLDVNGEQTSNNLSLVEPEFTDIFKLEVIAGNLDYVLQNPGFIAVEASVAEDLFGLVAMGQIIVVSSVGTQGGEVQFEVGAIFRLPEHLSNPYIYRLLAPMDGFALVLLGAVESQWQDTFPDIWLTFKPDTDLASVDRRLIDFVNLCRHCTAFILHWLICSGSF